MSISEKQLRANRANAQKSTGPRTPEGKYMASRNATKHGLFSEDIVVKSANYSESQEEYDQLLDSMIRELRPEGTLQTVLVTRMANCVWRSRRAIKVETAEISRQLDKARDQLRSDQILKNIRARTEGNEPESLTAEEGYRAIEYSIANRSLPDNKTCLKVLRYEMRMDRQFRKNLEMLKMLKRSRKDEKKEKEEKKAKKAKKHVRTQNPNPLQHKTIEQNSEQNNPKNTKTKK